MKKKKKRVLIIICCIIAFVLLIGAAGIIWYTGEAVFENSTQLVTNEETTGVGDSFWEKYGMNYNTFISNYIIEEIEIESLLDGHIIPADYIYTKGNSSKSNDTVILVHGLGGNRLTTYPIAEYFLEEGFNVITYDQRSSGENTAQYTTFGCLESKDAKDCVLYANQYTGDKRIGLWGTSFGGATVGIALGDEEINKIVDFAILDCPVSNMVYMIQAEMEQMDIGIPMDYLLFCGNLMTKAKLGFGYTDADVCNYIANTSVPVLIFNSLADDLTPAFMGENIYAAILHENKKLVTVEDSQHAAIWTDYNDRYKKELSKFINLTD